ncbi:MAG: iron-containing alcohol dehydrogenase [Bacilli bacterium]|nr:iron-containing alcohol dehydrogenase [Bacilli bacterium]
MKNFDFISPTKIYFGKDRENEIGRILKSFNAKKVLIVAGQSSIFKSGLYDRVISSIEKENIQHFLLSGVRANPTFDLVKKGVEIARENNVNFILPIGGGSVIDTAKCIAVNFDNHGDVKDYNLHIKNPEKALPIGVILTIAAAGSELSNSCVIQDDETGVKSGFNSDLVRPVFVVENPELTISVNKEQTAYGIVDILMHSMERYFCYSEEYELADEFALGLIKNVFDVGLLCYNNPTNYEYRARIMLASSFSHNGVTSIGKQTILTVHQLEHPVSGLFPNIAHGLGLAVLWPAWARYYCKINPNKFAYLGERVFNLSIDNKFDEAMKTIELIEEYFTKLGMPLKLSTLGIKESDIDALVEKVNRKGTRVVPYYLKDMDEEVVETIYRSCL